MNQTQQNKRDSNKPIRREKVTIQDLADHLNLAKGTVSRALNKYPDIAESTQLRVARAAKELGYRPSSHAQAIRTGLVKSVGLVLNVAGENSLEPDATIGLRFDDEKLHYFDSDGTAL